MNQQRNLPATALATPTTLASPTALATRTPSIDPVPRFPDGAPTLVPALWQALLQQPQRCALYWHTQQISRGQLLHKSRVLAQQLTRLGIEPGQRIAVLLPRSPDMLVVLLALWWCGAVPVPLDPAWPRARIEAVLDSAAPARLLSHAELHARWERSSVTPVLLEPIDYEQLSPAAEELATPHAGNGTAAAYLLYTSGSSGTPKGVLVDHAALATLCSGVLPLLQLQEGWRVLGCSAFCFDIVWFEWLAPLLCKGSLVLADADTHRDPQRLLQLIRSARVDVVQATPSLWALLLQQSDAEAQQRPDTMKQQLQASRLQLASSSPQKTPTPLQQLQLGIATGEALPRPLARRLLDVLPCLWNLYGPTECTVWSSARRVDAAAVSSESGSVDIGQPLPGYRFTLLPPAAPHAAGAADNATASAAGSTASSPASSPVRSAMDSVVDCVEDCADERGELLISGAGVACGYVAADATHAARFQLLPDGTRSFRSGDLCRRDAAGNYHFLRRCDGQLKVNGHRIEAGEVEMRLCSHTSIRAAACLVRSLPGGDQLLACVVCEPGTPNKDRERWNRHLANWLPEWMLPHRYFVLDALPLDANGKLDRAALLPLLQDASADSTAVTADPLQAAVTAAFRSVLDCGSIAPSESFFDLGGNSMLAATLLLALNQRCGTSLGLRDMLAAPPTVLRLTRLLRAAGARV